MSRAATDVQESVPSSPPLPEDHVLGSGAVLFPGAFDQHGCPLIVFPVDGQDALSSELSKAEVVDFINYFLRLHNKKQAKESLLSVVADLRNASPPTTRFIAETLLQLELHQHTVHSVYMIQPRKKEVVKLLLKHLVPSKPHTASFKKVLLKEISELSNYIDRSQLPTELGGYLIYSHHSWVAFIKEIDAFNREFLSVVQRLPPCVSALRSLSRLPLPSTSHQLQHFCSTNQATFLQLRRELGLDELLVHCERVVERLRCPDQEQCYQDMAGTALYTRTSHDMLRNHARITAAVEKVECLWQRAFSKAHLQLQALQLQETAQQVTQQIIQLFQDKLEPYQMEITREQARAEGLEAHFEATIYTPAVALVRCAEDVIHTSAELQPYEGPAGDHWAADLHRLKDKLHSAVHFILQTLRAVSNYHLYYNKASGWYTLVLFEDFLQALLSGVGGEAAPAHTHRRNHGTVPAWRHKMAVFLNKNPPPDAEELLHLANVSSVIPDDELQQAGQQMSQRCMTLRKLLLSPGAVHVGNLQRALQWQYEFLRDSHVSNSPTAAGATNLPVEDAAPAQSRSRKQRAAAAEGTPVSLCSLDSGFDGAASGQVEAWVARAGEDALSRITESSLSQTGNHRDETFIVSDPEDGGGGELDFGSAGNSSRAGIPVGAKARAGSVDLEMEVRRSAPLPSNPWLSLPVDHLEDSYTVTVAQDPTPQERDLPFLDPSDPYGDGSRSSGGGDRPTQTEVSSSTQTRDWVLNSHSSLDDPELSPMGDVLSSTFTDGRDRSLCTTEGRPTLLWDSYDLHEQNPYSVDGSIDISSEDWDLKEQEGLREVEKILGRTDEILEKEEEVVAQEAVLDALLRSEDRRHQRPQWNTEYQLGVMSSSELAEAGVLISLDEYLAAESEELSEPRSTGSTGDMKAPEGYGPEAAYRADGGGSGSSRPGLLTELKEVQVLDELIVEESMKIHELRRQDRGPDEGPPRGKPLDPHRLLRKSREREAFRAQLEKEKLEVETLEKSLEKERKGKRHKDRPRKTLKGSTIESATTDDKQDLAQCDEVLSGLHNEPKRPNFHDPEVLISEPYQGIVGPGFAKEATTQDYGQLLPGSQCVDHLSEDEPTAFNRTILMGASDFKEAPEEPGVGHQGYTYGEEVDGSGGENPTVVKPEASLTPETRPDDGAFDPGGESRLPPRPKPRKVKFAVDEYLAEEETPSYSAALEDLALSSVDRDLRLERLDLWSKPPDEPPDGLTRATAGPMEDGNNNNIITDLVLADKLERLSETSSTEGEDTSVGPACFPRRDPPLAGDTQDSDSPAGVCPSPLPAPRLPPEHGELSDEDQSSWSMRIPRSGSPGTQAQLDSNTKKSMKVTDFKTPIVLDTGSGLMKAGFADQNLPNVTFPTIIGMPKYEEIMNGSFERETYIGHEAQQMRGVLALKHPIKNGIIRNWDDMEKIWHHTFQQLGVDPEDHPVMLTEAAMNPLENRRRMVQIMFECFNVPFTYVAMQAVLALYASGRATGVVFDSGDGVSHSVPVFEGYSLPHAVQRFPLAGVDVTMHLKKLLQEQGVSMRTTAELEIVREMKEQCCCVALDYEEELRAGGAAHSQMHYTMPDGQTVSLHTERFRAPEILFQPELIGRDHPGMHQSVFKSILSSDIDLRRCLLGNIVLSGGNTQLRGLPERLQEELRGLCAADLRDSVRVSCPERRDLSVWSGGAALAALPSFDGAWISQEEYDESGPEIVFRKCF